MTKITKEQFEALRPSRESLIEFERDVEYSTERFLDENDCEIAWASYHSYRGAEYYHNETPRPRAAYDEDGNQIGEGF